MEYLLYSSRLFSIVVAVPSWNAHGYVNPSITWFGSPAHLLFG